MTKNVRVKSTQTPHFDIKTGTSKLSQALPPHFSLEYLARNTKYSIENCPDGHKVAFANRLDKLSQLTWQQIFSSDRHSFGTEKIPRNIISVEIPSYITEDIKFLAFRFSGNCPMVGYRSDRVFYIIWLDHDYTLYPHS